MAQDPSYTVAAALHLHSTSLITMSKQFQFKLVLLGKQRNRSEIVKELTVVTLGESAVGKSRYDACLHAVDNTELSNYPAWF